jgi:hypothetical protein
MSNFLLGGRMGDFIHMLWVVKNTPGKHDLFVTDRRDLHSDGFIYPLEDTIKELEPILMQQDYVNSVSAYNDEDVINLNLWRRHAYSDNWVNLLSKTFGVPVNSGPWVHLVTKSDEFSDKVVFHQSANPDRRGHHWQIVIDKYIDAVFIGSNEEYQAFGYKVPHYLPNDLMGYFIAINSCKFFVGNQSAPLAIAHALGVNRLAMLNEVDRKHYVGEERTYNNFYWMCKNDMYFEGINY